MNGRHDLKISFDEGIFLAVPYITLIILNYNITSKRDTVESLLSKVSQEGGSAEFLNSLSKLITYEYEPCIIFVCTMNILWFALVYTKNRKLLRVIASAFVA